MSGPLPEQGEGAGGGGGEILSGRYRLEELIGRGGMATVHRAVHLALEREVAIKLMASEMASDDEARARFLREARAASRLQHPNTISILDFGVDERQRLFLVMELLHGESLSAVLRSRQPMPPPRVVRLIAQVCGSLQEAHSQGLVHRDMKPSNIFVTELAGAPDSVKVLDFGLAKSFGEGGLPDATITRSGEVLGTPLYMSPEQAQGEALGPASDLYSVGVILYQALTGQPPFDGHSHPTVLFKHCFEAPVDPRQVRPEANIPADLAAVALRALAKAPADRYASGADFRAALLSCAAASTPYVPSPGAAPILPADLPSGALSGRSVILARQATSQAARSSRRGLARPLVAGGLVGVLLLAVAGGVTVWRMSQRPPKATTTPTEPDSAPGSGERRAPPDEPSAGTATARRPARRAREVSVRLSSRPEGASVLERGEELGRTPLLIRRVADGRTLRLELQHDRCTSATEEVLLAPEGPARLERSVQLRCRTAAARRPRRPPPASAPPARPRPAEPPPPPEQETPDALKKLDI